MTSSGSACLAKGLPNPELVSPPTIWDDMTPHFIDDISCKRIEEYRDGSTAGSALAPITAYLLDR